MDKKPTKKELDKVVEEAKDLKEEEVEKIEEVKEKTEKEGVENEEADREVETTEGEAEIVEDETPEEETPTEPVEKEVSPEIDYKERFVESTREAQILHSKNRKLDEAISEASEIKEPTEDEMRREFPDWDSLDDVSQKLAKEGLINKRRFEMIHEASQESKRISQWNEKVDKFLDNPETFIKYPRLEGRQIDFKVFATKPTRRGIDFEDLISAFLYTHEEKKTKRRKRKQMFETGVSGDKRGVEKATGKITLEEARILRETNYDKYREYLKAGKIDMNL